MYIAMNRFRVVKDQAKAFEQLWATRESYLHEMKGFVEFHLLKGPEKEDHQLYSSHTLWETYEDFLAWTKSDAFRKAHARAGNEQQTLWAQLAAGRDRRVPLPGLSRLCAGCARAGGAR